MPSRNPNFHYFSQPVEPNELPDKFADPYNENPHVLAQRAASELEVIIQSTDWNHNFGLCQTVETKAMGKMFGVLIVKDAKARFGYLAGFSGKIGDRNRYPGFVPPIFDTLEPNGFLVEGMRALGDLNREIDELENVNGDLLKALKKARTDHSNSLQERIYESYQLLNVLGEVRSLKKIFSEQCDTKPPGGAGDCAGPRLLQYAFQHNMRPLVLAEFWWGCSEDSPQWKHKEFYRPCEHKCKPILKHMLKGLS